MNSSTSDWIAAFTQSFLQVVNVFVGFFVDFFRQGLAAFLF